MNPPQLLNTVVASSLLTACSSLFNYCMSNNSTNATQMACRTHNRDLIEGDILSFTSPIRPENFSFLEMNNGVSSRPIYGHILKHTSQSVFTSNMTTSTEKTYIGSTILRDFVYNSSTSTSSLSTNSTTDQYFLPDSSAQPVTYNSSLTHDTASNITLYNISCKVSSSISVPDIQIIAHSSLSSSDHSTPHPTVQPLQNFSAEPPLSRSKRDIPTQPILDSYISARTKAYRAGTVLFEQSTKYLKTTLDTTRLFVILDNLNLRLTSLVHNSVLDHVKQQRYFIGNNQTLIILRQNLNIMNCNLICNENSLQLAGIWAFRNMTEPIPAECPRILLSDQLMVNKNKIMCTITQLTQYTTSNEVCFQQFKYMSSKLAKSFYPSYPAFFEDITKKYVKETLFATISSSAVDFTHSEFGCCACFGSPSQTPPADALGSQISKSYNQQLQSAITSYISYLTTLVSNTQILLDDLVNQAYTTTYNALTQLPKSVLVSNIKSIFPTLLPEHHGFSNYPSMPDFDSHFYSTVGSLHDLEFYQLFLDTDLTNLSIIQLNQLHAATLTFQQTLLQRLYKIQQSFITGPNLKIDLPHAVLHTTNTSVSAFKHYITNIFGIALEESQIALIYKIISNQKYNLFLELHTIIPNSSYPPAFLQSPPTSSPKLIDPLRTTAKPTTTPKPANPRAHIENILDQLPQDQPLSSHSTHAFLTDLSKAIEEIQKSLTPPSSQNLTTLPPSSIDPQLLNSTSPIIPHIPLLNIFPTSKVKRSIFSGFWGSIFGLATQDDVDNIKIFDHSLVDREKYLENSFLNLTQSTNDAIHTVQNISADLSSLISHNKQLSANFLSLFDTTLQTDHKLDNLLVSLKTTLQLTNVYTQILTELTVITESVTKFTLNIHNLVHNTIEVSSFDPRDISRHLGQSYIYSLQHAASSVTFNGNFYEVSYTFPVLSSPFALYSIKSLPIRHQPNFVDIVKTDKYVLLGGDYTGGSFNFELTGICSRKNDIYICNPELVPINQVLSCEKQIVAKDLTGASDMSSCYNSIVQTKTDFIQDYLFFPKNHLVVISSNIPDNITWFCGSLTDTAPLAPSINVLQYRPNCLLQTTYIHLLHEPQTFSDSSEIDHTDLDISQALSALDKLVVSNFNYSINYTAAMNILSNINSTLITDYQSIDDVLLSAHNIHLLDTTVHFNPFLAELPNLSTFALLLFISLQMHLVRTTLKWICCWPAIAMQTCSTACPTLRLLRTNRPVNFELQDRINASLPISPPAYHALAANLVPSITDRLTHTDSQHIHLTDYWMVLVSSPVLPPPVLFLLSDKTHFLHFDITTKELRTQLDEVVMRNVTPPLAVQKLYTPSL